MKMIYFGALLIAGFVISGCANNRDLIAKTSCATRSDVFIQIASSEAPPDKAIADINFSIKSNSSRFAEIYYQHSNPSYFVHLNIDGQTTILQADPVLEDKSPIDSKIPESGTGWKYRFSKRIALVPGKHKLTITLPVDDVVWAREIDLLAGVNVITVVPIYNERLLRPFKGQTFTAGVNTLEIIVN